MLPLLVTTGLIAWGIKKLLDDDYSNSNYDDYDEKLKASQEAEARRQQARQQQLLQAATDSVDRILHSG